MHLGLSLGIRQELRQEQRLEQRQELRIALLQELQVLDADHKRGEYITEALELGLEDFYEKHGRVLSVEDEAFVSHLIELIENTTRKDPVASRKRVAGFFRDQGSSFTLLDSSDKVLTEMVHLFDRTLKNHEIENKYVNLLVCHDMLGTLDDFTVPEDNLEEKYLENQRQAMLNLTQRINQQNFDEEVDFHSEIAFDIEDLKDIKCGEWDHRYLPKLISFLYECKDKDKAITIINETLKNNFDKFLRDPNNSFGRHNLETYLKMRHAGLDADKWLKYDHVDEFILDVDKEEVRDIDIQGVIRAAQDLIYKLISRKNENRFLRDQSANKCFSALRQVLGKNPANLSRAGDVYKMFPVLSQYCSNLNIDEKDRKVLEEKLDFIKSELGIDMSAKQGGFTQIKLWDRNPAKDYFHGNYTHCCLALAGAIKNHDAMSDYLTYHSINVIEAVCNGRPIAQAFPQAVENIEDDEIFMGIDNIEVNNNYGERDGEHYRGIKDFEKRMKAFINKFSEDVRFADTLLGIYYNDFSTQGLHRISREMRLLNGLKEGDVEIYLELLGSWGDAEGEFEAYKFGDNHISDRELPEIERKIMENLHPLEVAKTLGTDISTALRKIRNKDPELAERFGITDERYYTLSEAVDAFSEYDAVRDEMNLSCMTYIRRGLIKAVKDNNIVLIPASEIDQIKEYARKYDDNLETAVVKKVAKDFVDEPLLTRKQAESMVPGHVVEDMENYGVYAIDFQGVEYIPRCIMRRKIGRLYQKLYDLDNAVNAIAGRYKLDKNEVKDRLIQMYKHCDIEMLDWNFDPENPAYKLVEIPFEKFEHNINENEQ